jgi:phenylalanyl-tRNA synthetase beta chain
MRVSRTWLEEFVATGWDAPTLASRMTMAGFEVEAVEPVAGPTRGVVVGKVISLARHPNAERLTVCQVDSGRGAVQVVCGADNVRPGLTAPLALEGAELPGPIKIKRTILRGVESQGMLCSARELGMGSEGGGLLELPDGLTVGADLRQALDLDDHVLEVNLTPNRGDALSHLGLAREIAVLADRTLRMPQWQHAAPRLPDVFPVTLSHPGCPKFACRVLRGLDPTAPSPWWLKERLRRAGLRSLGPMVDVTNYVMLELGQPLHAYDLRRLNKAIDVRLARAGESLKLLDGRTLALDPDVLVITDASGPIGLAGIMGGEPSGIAPDTRDVLLEGAWFAPEAVLGRSRRYGLITDAGQRFERGVDPTGQERGIERASQLLLDIAGGQAGPLTVAGASPALAVHRTIEVRYSQLDRLIGISVPRPRAAEILTQLGLEVKVAADRIAARPPSWRFDLAQEADLVEEVARVYGYNDIPAIDLPAAGRPAQVPEGSIGLPRQAKLLADRGYQEAITYSFVDPVLQRRLFPDTPALALANPISAELAEMRVSLWPGLLGALAGNVRRQQERVRLFEVGTAFRLQSGSLTEAPVVGGIAWGLRLPEQWGAEKTAVDFYDVKGDVEALLAGTGQPQSFAFIAATQHCLHPGRSARILRAEQSCGWIGELHPELAALLELKPAPILWELDSAITSESEVAVSKELSKFPSLRRDLAVVVDEAVTFSELRNSVTVAASGLLRELKLFDIYRGRGIETGRKSIALGLILQETSRTLTDADADAVVGRVADGLRRDFRATLRE